MIVDGVIPLLFRYLDPIGVINWSAEWLAERWAARAPELLPS